MESYESTSRWVGLFGACLLLACGACTQVRYLERIEDFEEEVQALEARLARQPEDAGALRDLGVLYMRARQFSKGNEYLREAFARDPDDPKTLFYLGLARETTGQEETALRLYEKYTEVSRSSPYRKLMQGRHRWLLRRRARDEVKALIASEESLAGERVSPQVLAVYPLAYAGGDERYATLGRGLSEMISVDLANVPALTLVERVQLQTLLDELALASSEYMDPSTTPRVGHLLGAGRLIGGSYNITEGRDLHLDVAYWQLDVSPGSLTNIEQGSDVLDNLFRLEKELVFSLIDKMGFRLTPEQQRRIEHVPTQNLQAFLAYSRGLAEEDRGRFAAAARHYQQAIELDPGFEAAVQAADAVQGLSAVGGASEEALAAALDVESPGPSIDLVEARLRKLNESLGSNFLPGQDRRNPAEEFSSTPLPVPPPPPAGN